MAERLTDRLRKGCNSEIRNALIGNRQANFRELIDIGKEIEMSLENIESITAINDSKFRQGDKPTCFICKNTGHMRRNCPDKANQASKVEPSICVCCGEKGHLLSFLTKDRKKDKRLSYLERDVEWVKTNLYARG